MSLLTHRSSHASDAWLWAMAWLALCLCLASSTSCFAESIQKTSRDADVVLTVTASVSTVQVAEPLTLELKVTAPVGTKVSFPIVGEQLGEWDVLNHSDALEIPSQEGRMWIRNLTLETIQTGDIEIPSIEIVWIASGGDAGSARSVSSKPLFVRIASVLEEAADLTKFRDIRSVVDVPIPEKPETTSWFQVAMMASAVAGCMAVAFLVVTARRRRPKITARKWALKEINSLTASDSFKRGESESVLSQLSSIVREYFGFEFGVSAPMQTTEELLTQVTAMKLLSTETSERIKEALVTADRAKFAGLKLTNEQLAHLVEQTRDAILEPPFVERSV